MQTIIKTLQQLLKGKNQESQQRWDDYLNTIPDNPNILWYPSAGYDFRDLSELSAERASIHGIDVLSDIYLHNDLSRELSEVKIGEIYNYDKTIILLTGLYELELRPSADVTYEINPEYSSYVDDQHQRPKIQLMEITRRHANEDLTTGVVLYFNFENNNFLDQVILRHKIPISHIVKIREGVAAGGVRMSIAYVLDLLSELETKYLIYGDSVSSSITDLEYIPLEEKLRMQYNLNPCTYNLIKKGEISKWSGYVGKIFEIQYVKDHCTPGYFITYIDILGY